MRNELKQVKEREAGGSKTEDSPIECPDNLSNLQAAMGLANDHMKYAGLFVSCFLFSFLLSM